MSKRTVNDNILDDLNNGILDFIPKNPYVRKAQKLEGTLFSINGLLNKFDTLFVDNARPLIIEIGSYMGETLMALALKNPELNFLGVDIVFKRVVKTAEKIEKNGLKNVKMVLGDGMKLIENLPKDSISGVCVFFPDPWEKKIKKRLINDLFLKSAKVLLKKKGFLWIKTDHEGYHLSFKDIFTSNGFYIKDKKPDLLTETVYPTYFESIFENQNKSIYEVVLSNS